MMAIRMWIHCKKEYVRIESIKEPESNTYMPARLSTSPTSEALQQDAAEWTRYRL